MVVPDVLRLCGRLENAGVPGVSAVLARIFPVSLATPRFWAGVVTRSDGLRMHVDTRRHIERTYLVRGQYEPQLARLMRSIVRAGDRVLDVGANIGGHTLTLAQAVGPQGHVFAFEPNPQARTDLVHNLALNDIRNVTVRPVAVGDAPGLVHLRIPLEASAEGANVGLASIEALDTPHRTVEVPVVVLDSEMEPSLERPIRLIKIDVQGYEPRAFMGMERLLRADRPFVIFEYEPWAIKRSGFEPQWLWDFFERLEYQLFLSDHPDSSPVSRAAFVGSETSDFLAVATGEIVPR